METVAFLEDITPGEVYCFVVERYGGPWPELVFRTPLVTRQVLLHAQQHPLAKAHVGRSLT